MTFKVIDGDTFEAIVDESIVTIRLAGVGAPEANEPNGRLATRKLKRLLADSSTIDYKERAVDRYGRLVCDVWNEQGVHVNQAMREYLGGYFGR